MHIMSFAKEVINYWHFLLLVTMSFIWFYDLKNLIFCIILGLGVGAGTENRKDKGLYGEYVSGVVKKWCSLHHGKNGPV